MTNKQIMHKANGIARIAQAVKLCKLAPVETGTIYSNRFKEYKFNQRVKQLMNGSELTPNLFMFE